MLLQRKIEGRAIMNIRRILLVPVGAAVGFVAGLIIGGLGLLVGLPFEFMLIVWGLCAIAGGYLAFVEAVPMKALLYLALGVVVAPVLILFSLGYFFFTHMGPPILTPVELRQILETCSCEPEIQAEVDNLLSRFGEVSRFGAGSSRVDDLLSQFGDKSRPPDDAYLSDEYFSMAPVLDRFGDMQTLGDRTFAEIVPRDEFGLPSHLRLRFQHFHHQYILFFRTGTDASLIMSSNRPYEGMPNRPVERVTGNIYFNPGEGPIYRK